MILTDLNSMLGFMGVDDPVKMDQWMLLFCYYFAISPKVLDSWETVDVGKEACPYGR